jgi:hypoxanthine phosphoribosyltransferase
MVAALPTVAAALAPLAIKPLFSAETIARRTDALARAIAEAGLNDPLIVAVLKGSFIFAADLVRALHEVGLQPEIDFIFLASYGAGTASQGEVQVLRDVGSEVAGRDVVLVDDILDSGRTLAFAKALLLERGARKVLTCVLIDKQVSRAVPIVPDFAGFACPPVFVVGYGMDLGHRYRELPFIGEVSGGQGTEPNPKPKLQSDA